MTGAQHYQAAERALSNARETYQDTAEERDGVRTLLAEAQVHATLAQAAATIDAAGTPDGYGATRRQNWYVVLEGGQS